MPFEILRRSALTDADRQTLPEAKQLSILAAETMGLHVRRREATLRGYTEPRVVFDWSDPNNPPPTAGGVQAQPTWKTSPPSFATDIGAAIDLLIDASRRGYRVTITSIDDDEEGHRSRVEMVYYRWNQAAHRADWLQCADASARGPAAEAEAITTAYLILSKTIMMTEEPQHA